MAQSTLPIERINALAELERLGWKFAPTSADEVELCCPAPDHNDSKPSALLNIRKNLWKCHAASCAATGDVITLLAYIATRKTSTPVDRQVMIHELSKRYELEDVKSLSPAIVERMHAEIWRAGPLLQELYNRGLTDSMIRKARLGYHDGRITIPVYDQQRRIVNIRRYLPGAPGPEKMRNTKGYGKPRLYQVEQTRFDTIWVCGGEMKSIVAGALLNEHGVGAVCVTAGEGAWEPAFTELFVGKRVYVCLDVDAGGKAGSRRIAQQLCMVAANTWIVQLPLDLEKYPKGDINDYVGQEHAGADELLKLMEAAKPYTPESIEQQDPTDPPIQVKLASAVNSAYVGHRISTEAVVQAIDTTPYLVPKLVNVACTKDQPNCAWCAVKAVEPDPVTGKVALTVKSTSPGILTMVQAPAEKMREAIREGLRLPVCKAATFTVKDHYDVLDVRLTPQLEMGGDNRDHVMQPAFVVGAKVELNTPYKLTGRVFPHPKNQQAVLLLDEIDQARDSLVAFAPTVEEMEALRIFRAGSEGIDAKLLDIYNDIEANVTRIFKRRELHLALDLTYHSALYFHFDGRLQNGWVNAIITGDSAQGKTELTQRLIQHYGLGERVDCKNATAAGLLGGLQQLGNRWFVSWGVIPMHDKRLVMLEEIKGTAPQVLSSLTDMRSSGTAEIARIEKRRAHARTRLVFISNPRGDRPVSAYNFGIETIKELMGALEDIRRFDVAVVLSAKQISAAQINQLSMERPTHEHKYTSELCRRLVLWAWTRTPEQIIFEAGAEAACLQEAVRLTSKYSDELPLIDSGTTKFKLARLAIGLAARVFSTDDADLAVLHVTEAHVRYVAQWLDAMYSDPTFGYTDFSRAQAFAHKVVDPATIQRQILGTKYPADLVDSMLHRDEIQFTDFQDWCELDRDDAQRLLSFFVRKHALYRVKRWYVKTSEFIALLKTMKERGLPKGGEAGKDEAF